ncbi:hypothetical protein ACLOJK_015380 [Asimina triloba]
MIDMLCICIRQQTPIANLLAIWRFLGGGKEVNSSSVGREMRSKKAGRRTRKSDLVDELWRLESISKMIRKVNREEGKSVAGCRPRGRWEDDKEEEGDRRS